MLRNGVSEGISRRGRVGTPRTTRLILASAITAMVWSASFANVSTTRAARVDRPHVAAQRIATTVARQPCFHTTTKAGDAGVTVTKLRIHDVPALVRSPPAVSKPPIILWHGFGLPNSEQALMEALPLDEVAAEKIYLGLPMFGERSPPGGMEELARLQLKDYLLNVLGPVLSGAAQDLVAVSGELRQRGCVGPDEPINLFGFSAGGFAVLNALVNSGVRVGVAVTINAPTSAETAASVFEHATHSAYPWSNESRNLAKRVDLPEIATHSRALSSTALLLIQGASDDPSYPIGAQRFERALRPLYHEAHQDARLELMLLPGVSHSWVASEATRDSVRKAAADWFNRFSVSHSAWGAG